MDLVNVGLVKSECRNLLTVLTCEKSSWVTIKLGLVASGERNVPLLPPYRTKILTWEAKRKEGVSAWGHS